MPEPFRVGLTRDFLRPDGTPAFPDVGLHLLDAAPGIHWEVLPPPSRPSVADAADLEPEQVRGYDALLVLAPRVSATTLAGADRLALVARFGVGYDNVDVAACSRAGVLLTITPDGVRRPVATSVLAYLLALSLRLVEKDRLVRDGRWADKLTTMGTGLVGRVLGIVGFGNIGREVSRLARPLGMRHQVFDPYRPPADAAAEGVESVDLDALLRASDVVTLHCALTPETHHLLDARRLALLRPTAFLINTARGPIVDQAALTEALATRSLAGAALDVFEREPLPADDPLLRLDNVLLAPHAICWTDECFRGNGESACQAILDLAAGRRPRHAVNPEAFDHPRLRARLDPRPRGGLAAPDADPAGARA